jgi:hypothetical protein
VTDTTYILEDIEVKRTGRIAKKQRRQIVGRPAIPDEVLVEVTPVAINEGNWKKWVPEASLFEVINDDSVK